MPSALTKCICKGFADVYDNDDGTSTWVFNMQLWGGTIPKNVEQNFSVNVIVDDDSLGQIATKVDAAARAYAASKGITIAANKDYLINFTGF